MLHNLQAFFFAPGVLHQYLIAVATEITKLSCALARLAVVLQEIHRREERWHRWSGHAVGGILCPQLRLELPSQE